MGQKRTVDYMGRKVEAETVEIEPTIENWTIYKLSDGTIFKMRLSLLQVVRILNEFNPETGDPIYSFTAQQITSVESPDNLRQKK